MNRFIGTFALILVIQCVMLVILHLPDDTQQDRSKAIELLPLDPDRIDEIHIEDDEGAVAVLLNLEGNWILPDLGGLPADAGSIDKLINGLANQPAQWPTATTASSRQRFQVAAYHYQRKITLISEGELLGAVYLGTSPGFRKVHARNDAQEEIYSIAFNTFDAPSADDAWLDRSLLQEPNPRRISGDGFDLSLDGGDWQAADGRAPEARELAAVLLGLESLQISGIADESARQSLVIAAPQIRLQIEGESGSQQLELFDLGSSYFIRSDRFADFFTLSAYDYDRLATLDGKRLNGQTQDNN